MRSLTLFSLFSLIPAATRPPPPPPENPKSNPIQLTQKPLSRKTSSSSQMGRKSSTPTPKFQFLKFCSLKLSMKLGIWMSINSDHLLLLFKSNTELWRKEDVYVSLCSCACNNDLFELVCDDRTFRGRLRLKRRVRNI
ncbi:unnamed protein product [Trifolium pratense]|uniref:Uncharacterized protein n=1 Tax=Trifolium pratense TaxID=57577 RepID=A0ACB0IL20_TRIPR|nr:unnamed protein product [Trifolium pratense]